jgi:hypothetical protein
MVSLSIRRQQETSSPQLRRNLFLPEFLAQRRREFIRAVGDRSALKTRFSGKMSSENSTAHDH